MKCEAAESDRPGRRLMVALALGVFAVGCVMGSGALGGDFLSGDDVHLVLNHVLVNHPSPAHALKLLGIIHRDLYQPIPMISFSLDFEIIRLLGLTPFATGPDAGAWVFHLTNVLIHAANGVLVFWLFARVQRHRGVAVVAAMLFALHPYAAEVAAWLNGRMTLLATLFSLASLIAIDAHLQRRRGWLVVLTLLFVALAMASKVQVGLPALMLALPLARRQWPSRRWWALWVAVGVLTAGFTALNIATTSASEMFAGAAEKLQGSRIARTILVLAWYFQHYLLPVGMSPWHPPETMVNWSHSGIPSAIGWLAVIAAGAVWSWRYTRVGVLGLLWFLATVASTLPLIPSRDVMAADRYVYLPNIGLHWIVAALLVHLVLWAGHKLDTRLVAHVAGGLGVAGAGALLPYTWHVESYYLSNLAKAGRIAELYPNEPGVWEDVGWAYYRDGRYAEAIEAAKGDLERHPLAQACEVYQLMGMAQYRLGYVDEGIATLFKAIEADPQYGKCYSRLGQIHYELGRDEEAVAYYTRAVEIMPQYLPAIQALGRLYQRMGQLDEAVRWFQRGLALNRFDPVSTTALAEIEMTRGDTTAAIKRFERLLSWQPENNLARTNLGVCYANTGRIPEAVRAYEEVLRRDPTAATAALNLAGLKAQAGDQAEAVALVQQACRNAPTDRTMLVGGHDLLAGSGRLREAAALWAQALGQEPDAPDLAAWYAWTSALAAQWEPAEKGARAALSHLPAGEHDPAVGRHGEGAPSLAWATLVLVDLARDDPEEAVAKLNELLAQPPDPADAPQRLLAAITAVGQRDPENPWPYFVAARLLLAGGQLEAAQLAAEEFIRRAPSPEWRSRAEVLLQAAE